MGAAIEGTSVEMSPKLKTEPPHGPAIHGKDPQAIFLRDTWAAMFVLALFTAAKRRIILAAYQRMSG